MTGKHSYKLEKHIFSHDVLSSQIAVHPEIGRISPTTIEHCLIFFYVKQFFSSQICFDISMYFVLITLNLSAINQQCYGLWSIWSKYIADSHGATDEERSKLFRLLDTY